MNNIKCPHDLNQFLLGEPKFENTFSEEECEQRKFYGDCYHCFSTAIAKRDQQLKNNIDKIRADIQENINYNKKMDYKGIMTGLLLSLDIINKYNSEGRKE